jgi:hypothetical protein
LNPGFRRWDIPVRHFFVQPVLHPEVPARYILLPLAIAPSSYTPIKKPRRSSFPYRHETHRLDAFAVFRTDQAGDVKRANGAALSAQTDR